MTCPDCGQLEYWAPEEADQHGLCRAKGGPCWCEAEPTFTVGALADAAAAEGKNMNRNLALMAEQLYSMLYGDIDDKRHKAQCLQELLDWLEAGDLQDNPTLEALAQEWREREEAAEEG